MQSRHNEIQAFLKKYVGRCKTCGHELQQIGTVHRKHEDGYVMYDSGLALRPTHWNITEVDEGEPTGVGCTECEKGYMHAVKRDRFYRPKDFPKDRWVYCVEK